jgi:hypothetical protein
MNASLIDLLALPVCVTYTASFLYFDRLLCIEARSFPEAWKDDGQPVGIRTWAREAGANCRPYCDIFPLIRFLRLYLLWLFRTPDWVRQNSSASKALWTARSLFCLFLIELMVLKELMDVK